MALFQSAPQESTKHLMDAHAKISELLLQCLLKVDGVVCDFEAVRLKRKETVKHFQELLDQVDALKRGIKEAEKVVEKPARKTGSAGSDKKKKRK